MKIFSIVVFLFSLNLYAAAPPPEPDLETKQYSRYAHEVNYLNGIFYGVLDYCQSKSNKIILDSAVRDWMANNGVYINSVDVALEKFVAKRVEKNDADRVIKALREQNLATLRSSRANSPLVKQIKESKNEQASCSYHLGVLVSKSFYFEKIAPSSHQYWADNIKP
jgi:hypothetical protein